MIDISGNARPDYDGVRQHRYNRPVRVDGQDTDITSTGYRCACVQIQLPDSSAAINIQCGASGPFVHRHLVRNALCKSKFGVRRKVDNLLNIASQLQLYAAPAFQPDVLQTQPVFSQILQICGGADRGLLDIGQAIGAQAYKLTGQAVNLQATRRYIAQDNATLTLLTCAGTAHHDLSHHRHIFQHHIIQSNTAGQIQIAGNDGVPECDA